MTQRSRAPDSTIDAAVRRLGERWHVPTLHKELTVNFSTRLQRTLGRAVPSTGQVTLSAALRRGSRDRLLRVLCHEAAHVVAFWQAAAKGAAPPRAHGPEWAALVRAAGYPPTVTAAPRGVSARGVESRSAQSVAPAVVHTCPVCQWRRRARRVMSAWLCPECQTNGLLTRLVATRAVPTQRATHRGSVAR